MVVQKTLNNLKERPKDERVAVASGTAIFVVFILFIGWAYFFLKQIQSGQLTDISSGAQDKFNFTSVQQAQEQLKKQYGLSDEEDSNNLKSFPQEAAARKIQNTQTGTPAQGVDASGGAQFQPSDTEQ
jgi:hypothetical protein